MKKIIFSLFTSLLLTSSAFAATKTEKITELLKLENTQATVDAVMNQALIPLTCILILSPEEEEKLKEDFIYTANFDSFNQLLYPFFEENFTEEELDDMLAFYRSPIGQKVTQLQPQLGAHMMQALQKWQEGVSPKLKILGEEYSRKYRQRSGEEAQACIQSKVGAPQ